MSQGKLMEQAKRAAGVATKAGASDARVYFWRSRGVTVEWRDGKLDRIRESTKQGFAISLYVDGRYSSNYTSDIRDEAVEKYVTDAVAATRYLAADEHRKLPDPARYQGMTEADLETADPAISAVTPEDRLATAKQLEEAARAGDEAGKIVSVTSEVSDNDSRVVIFNTNGFAAEKTGTSFSRDVSVSISDTDDRKPRGFAYGSTRFAGDLPEVGGLGEEALKRALDQIGSKQAPTGKYEVVIENRAAPTFARHLLRPLSGGAVQQKRSFMEGKKGEQIGSELLTITDDPHLPRGLSSSPWDGEGMATARRSVFDKGVLKTFFLDTYYASKLGLEPTTGGVANLVWSGGERDAAAMVAAMKRGIFVTSFLGGNSNSTTGDFSLGIKGFLVEDGKVVHPVSEMNVAGNHLEFWKQLAEVGSDPWTYGTNRTPTLRFTDVQCSGSE